MSPPVLVGFAGVLVAAVATGMLAGRCARRPRIDFIVWTAATLGLTIALAAQSMGFAGGFSPVTFRAIQLFALLLAPLWLAWGLVELVVANEAARFGMRLVSSALTVVASVILATDPLTAEPFSKAWPLASQHFQPVSLYALDAALVVTLLAVAVSAGLAAARARSDPRWRPALAAVVPAGLAVLMTAALRFPLPAGAAYPLLSAAAAALVWFGVSRVRERPAARRNGRRDGVREGTGRYRSGTRPGDDYRPGDAYRPEDDHRPGAAYRPDDYRPDDYRPAAAYGPADDHVPEGQYAIYGQRGGPPEPGRPPRTGVVAGAAPTAMNGVDQGWRANPGPQPAMPERPDRYRGSWPGGAPADERWPRTQAPDTLGVLAGEAAGAAAAGAVPAGVVPAGAGPKGPYGPGNSYGPYGPSGAESGAQAGAEASPAAAPARPYGRILIFTLLDDRVAEFDRLAEETAEEVRKGEPGTLVYVIHLVPNAPMQRIFYEIYRDRAAFDSHESQPYMQRFGAERRSFVLATNVIELRLKYAKVAPLPGPQAPAPAWQGLQPLPPADARGPYAPSASPRPQSLPPAQLSRYDQQRYDQQRYDQQRYDQPRYDQRWPDQERPGQRWPDRRQLPPAYQGPGG